MMRFLNSLLVSALLGMNLTCAVSLKKADPAPRDVPLHVRLSSFDIGDAEVNDDLMDDLVRIADVKNYGINVFGLTDTSNNYFRYRKPGEARVVYWLYMTPRTVLPEDYGKSVFIKEDSEHREDHQVPVVLRSSLDDLMDEDRFYSGKGLDTMHRTIHNFSDAEGCDITDGFLDSGLDYQVRVMFHEDWHATFDSWHPGERIDHSIHEPAAIIVGNAGAMEYFREKYGEDSDEYRSTSKNYTRLLDEAAVITDAYPVLKKIYDSGMSESVKISTSDGIFAYIRSRGYHHNNATLMDRMLYMKLLPLMATVHGQAGSVTAFINVMRDCPIKEDAAEEYLVKYLAAGGEPER